MLPSFCTEAVTVSRAPLASVRGARERDWASAATHEVAGCSAQPASTDGQAGEARHGIADTAVLYAPPGSDIEAGDRVSCSLGTYEVEGSPQPFASPTGAVSHVRVYLSAWRG